MTNNLARLTEALRRDTPEQLLMREIKARRSEIVETLKAGNIFRITDVCGRTIKFIPSGQPSKAVYPDALTSSGK